MGPAMRLVLFGLLAMTLLASDAAGAERQPAKKLLCVVDQSTGFNWKDGQWMRVSFARKSYIIIRRDPSVFDAACDVAAEWSTHEKVDWTSSKDLPDRVIRPACYEISTVGEKASTSTSLCQLHTLKNGGADIVECDGGNMEPFTAQAGGGFVISSVYGVFGTAPHNSVHVSIGSCSDISD